MSSHGRQIIVISGAGRTPPGVTQDLGAMRRSAMVAAWWR
jgi:hypothetical protein